MGDGTEPVPRLDAGTVREIQAAVMTCRTRKDLNRLTIDTWRTYDAPKNAAGLSQLRAAIEARRSAFQRDNPR